jgi:FkbM family methyltransferase
MIPGYLKKIFPSTFKRGIKEHLGVPSLHWSLMNIQRLGYTPKFAVDIGAYEGEWAISFTEVFPAVKVLMLEAQTAKSRKLEALSKLNPNLSYHIALLSSEDGKKLHFSEHETASHVTTSENEHTKNIISVSLDEIIRKKHLSFPDFLKLDVQGFEIEVLKGGKESLANAEFCLMEVTMLDLDNTPLVLEVMNYMDVHGFQLYDITQFLRRPFDKALYQADFLFIKKSSSFISSKRWN